MSRLFADLSNYQHGSPIDFHQVAQVLDGVVLKATESTTYVNPYFGADWSAAKAAGLEVHAYCFLRPEAGNPGGQVDYFVRELRGVGWKSEQLWLDCETGSGDVTDFLLAALTYLRAHAQGMTPGVYTGGWFAESHIRHDEARLRQYPLWDASYSQAEPAAPAPWSGLAAWQYTDKGQIRGISGNVDLSHFYLPAPQPASPPDAPHPDPPTSEEDDLNVAQITPTDTDSYFTANVPAGYKLRLNLASDGSLDSAGAQADLVIWTANAPHADKTQRGEIGFDQGNSAATFDLPLTGLGWVHVEHKSGGHYFGNAELVKA